MGEILIMLAGHADGWYGRALDGDGLLVPFCMHALLTSFFCLSLQSCNQPANMLVASSFLLNHNCVL